MKLIYKVNHHIHPDEVCSQHKEHSSLCCSFLAGYIPPASSGVSVNYGESPLVHLVLQRTEAGNQKSHVLKEIFDHLTAAYRRFRNHPEPWVHVGIPRGALKNAAAAVPLPLILVWAGFGMGIFKSSPKPENH